MKFNSCVKILSLQVLFILLLIASDVLANNELVETEVKVKSVALFKNGLGYFRSEINLPKNTNNVILGQLPVPAHGTFWVNYSKQIKVDQITTGMEEDQKPAPVQTIGQLLYLNVGRNVIVWTGSDKEQFLKGKIMDVVERKKEPATTPYFMGGNININRHNPILPTLTSPNILMLKTKEGIVALTVVSIQRVDFSGDDFIAEDTIKSIKPSIRIQLKEAYPNKNMEINWLAKGVSWVPSYRIDLSDPKTAHLTAKALIINEVMDLENVEVELVTGFPNIQFGEVRSPIAMTEPLSNFLNALSGDRTRSSHRGHRGQMLTQQAVMINAPIYGSFEGVPASGYSSTEVGKVSEDLFFYPIKNVTLKRGETAYLPLFSAELPYQHIYTWKIKDYLDEQNQYRQRNEQQSDGKLAEKVWHSCRFINTLKMPLTTAAAEFVKNDNFVGQDVCYYTAPEAKTTIRINRAMNVLAEQAEFELKRQRNAVKIHGYHYDKVKVRGELKLRSRLDKTVKMEISKELSGEVLKTSPKAKDTKTAKGLRQVNPKHNLIWEVDLEAGKVMKLDYEYQLYVRD